MARTLIVIFLTLTTLVACLWQGNRLAVETSERELALRAETWARMWTRHVTSDTNLVEILLQGQGITPEQWERISREMHDDNVFRFKLFDTRGRLIYDSLDGVNVNSDAVNSYSDATPSPGLMQALRTLKPVTTLFTGTSPDRPENYAETYLPLMDGTEKLAVFEVYLDVTMAAREIRPLFENLVLAVGLLMVSGMLVPLGFLGILWLKLEGSNKRLEASRQRAQDAERTKAEFLANMSHEIRTPMNGVIAMSELLEQSELNDEQRSLTRTITQSSAALLSIINDILDFSKVEAGKMQVHEESMDLLAVVQDAAALFSPTAEAKSLEIVVENTIPPPCFVIADPARLRQCLLNVVGNAVKFTLRGHVHIWIGQTDRGEISIKVTDTGVGIPEDMLDHIFEEFSQIEDGRTRQFEGTGLGLAITLRLTRLMGGTLTARSRKGVGSVFEFRFPLLAADAPEKARVFWNTAADRLDSRRIMVVETHDINRRALRTMLDFLRAKPVFARDAEGALRLMQALTRQNTPPDVCVIDGTLDNGLHQVLRQEIERVSASKDMPYVLMVNASQDLSSDRLKDLGYTALLRKPLETVGLASVLCSALGVPIDQAVPGAAAKSNPDTNLLSGKTILVAEDNATNRLVLKKLLASTGVTLEMARNGQEALDLYKDLRPDLMLMDVSMPIMNGYDATRHIREFEQQETLPRCPIVALTANAMTEHEVACRDAGMSDFLTKPVRRAELLDTLDGWLRPEDKALAG